MRDPMELCPFIQRLGAKCTRRILDKLINENNGVPACLKRSARPGGIGYQDHGTDSFSAFKLTQAGSEREAGAGS
jgi:hypothetical protein